MSKHTDKEILDAIMNEIKGWPYAERATDLVSKICNIHADMTREETEVEWLERRIEALRESMKAGGSNALDDALEADDAEVARREGQEKRSRTPSHCNCKNDCKNFRTDP